jgi:hypothetical protein
MSITINLDQTKTVEAGATPDAPIYRVKNEVVASEGVSLALFVFETEGDAFSHVATPRDLEAYADNKATAISEGTTYYRAAIATVDFDRIDDADSFATIVRSRLTSLTFTLPRAQATFTGEESYTFVTS